MEVTEDRFTELLRDMQQAPLLCVDTEGTLTHPFSATWGLSTSTTNNSEYFAFRHRLGNNLPESWLPRLAEVIQNHPRLGFHHAKHDLKALRNLGIDYKGEFYDLMLMVHMVDENLPSKKLNYVSQVYGGQPKRNEEVMNQLIKAFGWDYIPVDIIRPYGRDDAFITREAIEKVYPQFQAEGFDGDLWKVEQDFVRVLMDIEDNGTLIDQDLSQRELDKGLKIMSEIQKDLGFNPGSTVELGKFLLDELGLPVLKRSTKTNKPSFDKKVLEAYDELLEKTGDTRARQILTYRGWQKTTSSNYKPYLELLGPDGRLRPNYKMHGTRTGRLSCELPNLQQIPRESPNPWNGHLKDAFIVAPGRTAWNADYAQLEFRLGAAYGKVPRLLEIFSDPTRDIFSEIALDLNMVRQDVKTLVYTIQFGGQEKRISEVFGVSMLAAKAIKNNFFKRYEGLARVANKAQDRCMEDGVVTYWSGRKRHFKFRSSERHKAFNAVVQGGAFEIVKRTMIRLRKEGLHNPECRMDLQVHDAVRFDIENGKEKVYLPEIKRIMEDVIPDFGVKFKVDIKKWGSE